MPHEAKERSCESLKPTVHQNRKYVHLGTGCKPTKSLGDLVVAWIMCMDVDVCFVESLMLLTVLSFKLKRKGSVSNSVHFLGFVCAFCNSS